MNNPTFKLEVENVKTYAHGNWYRILTTLGIPAEYLRNKHQPCPACGGKDRFRFDDKWGDGNFICGQMGDRVSGNGFTLLMHVFGWDFNEALHRVAEVLGLIPYDGIEAIPNVVTYQPKEKQPPKDELKKYLNIWNKAHPLEPSDPVIQYLQGRGLSMSGEFPLTLRFHPSLPYWYTDLDGKWKYLDSYPAMIAAITNLDDTLAGLHYTYLKQTAEGYSKHKPIHPITGEELADKKMHARFKDISYLTGKGVHLFPSGTDTRLVVCEGIETALAARELTGLPVVAALSANGMKSFQWSKSIQHLDIYADHEAVGLKACEHLARRAALAKLTVETLIPPCEGMDALDELNAKKAAEKQGAIDD